ncbi:MAG: hypothetical protein R2844_03080 [Caldilineales bacterium]
MNVLRESMIGQVTSDLTLLPEEDLPLVVEFVDYLKDRRKRKTPQPLSVAEIRSEARRRAQLLDQMPREEIVARFEQLAEEIRREVIEKGTAVNGDWLHD